MLWIKITYLTWLELWQSRTYKILLGFALLAPVLGIGLAVLFMIDIGKVYMDSIAAIAHVLAMVLLLFVVVTLLSRDIFDRICYILLNPPATRVDYYWGRFAGVALVFFVLLLVLLGSSALGGFLYVENKDIFYQSNYSWFNLAQLIFFNYFQYISILGVIFFIVSWSSGDAETMLFTVSILIFSWLFPPVLKVMQNAEVAEKTPEFIVVLLQSIYEVLPHLQGSDISLRLAHGISIGWEQGLLYIAEHSFYGVCFFLLGLMIFLRRDL